MSGVSVHIEEVWKRDKRIEELERERDEWKARVENALEMAKAAGVGTGEVWDRLELIKRIEELELERAQVGPDVYLECPNCGAEFVRAYEDVCGSAATEEKGDEDLSGQ